MRSERHFLLVDDEVEIVDFMERFLKRLKISSTKATSGEEALRTYDKDAVDCVFLDLHMNGLDGFAVLEEIKKVNPEAKVIIIAGSADKASLERAKQLGAADYIMKPIDLSELKEKIDLYA